MTDRHRPWLWAIAIALALGMCGTQIPWMSEYGKGSALDYDRVRTLSRDEYVATATYLTELAQKPVGPSPDEYYRVLLEFIAHNAELEKYQDTAPDGHQLAGRYHLAGGSFGIIHWYQTETRYESAFGHRAMMAAAARANLNSQTYNVPTKMAAVKVLPLLKRGYLEAALLAVLFFMASLKLRRLLIWPELMRGRIFAYAAIWPAGLFLYPKRVDPRRQIKQAWDFVAGLLAASLSLAATAAAAGERTSEATDTTATGNVRVLCAGDLPKPPITVTGTLSVMSRKVPPNGFTVHDGPVASWDLSATLPTATTLEFSGTRALSGDPGSDELDYGVSQQAGDVTVSLNYFDIQRIGTGRGGDIIAPVISYRHGLGHGWTVSARGEYDFLTHGSNDRNGFVVNAGLTRTQPIIGSIPVDHTFSAAYGDGPFGQDAGLVLRYEGTATVPLSKKTAGWFKFRWWAPILGAHDRSMTWSASSGLSFAF